MKRHSVNKGLILCAMAALTPVVVWASTGPIGGEGRREPPQEAIDACKELSEGAAVEITTPRGDTLKATCRLVDGRLAAVPEGGTPGPENGAPPPGDGKEQ